MNKQEKPIYRTKQTQTRKRRTYATKHIEIMKSKEQTEHQQQITIINRLLKDLKHQNTLKGKQQLCKLIVETQKRFRMAPASFVCFLFLFCLCVHSMRILKFSSRFMFNCPFSSSFYFFWNLFDVSFNFPCLTFLWKFHF